MIRIMGTCWHLFKRSREPPRKLTLAMLGLDNAGKTLTARSLLGEDVSSVEPTVGFDTMSIKLGRYDITLYDLGGGLRIRNIWEHYYHELYGLVFVVDSSSVDRMSECRAALVRLLAHDRIKGKPMLLLANKQDVPGCLDENELREQLGLEQLVNEYCVPCYLVMCSAAVGTGKKMDGAIRAGLLWLLSAIDANFETLNEQVVADTEVKRQLDVLERAKRLERVRLAREQREQEENKEKAETNDASEAADAVVDDPAVDPFQRLNIKELEAKEKEVKKKSKKKLPSAAKNDSQNPGLGVEETLGSHSDIASPTEGTSDVVKDTKRVPPSIPSSTDDGSTSVDRSSVPTLQQKAAATLSGNGAVRKSRAAGSAVPASSANAVAAGEEVGSSGRRLPPLAPSSLLAPLDGAVEGEDESKKGKQRKKKLRKSQVAPGSGPDVDRSPSLDFFSKERSQIAAVPEAPVNNGHATTAGAIVSDDDDDAVVVST